MGTLFSYTLYSGLVLTALYLTYKWMLAGEKQHACNRGILLGIYAVALGVPALAAIVPEMFAGHGGAQAGVIDFGLIPVGAAESREAESFSPARVLLWIYIAGVAVAAAASIVTWVRLSRIIASGEKRAADGYTLILVDRTDIAPFSWRRYIVMSQADYDSAGPMITAHEREHLRLHHWLDLLAAQAVAVVMWYNPVAWLMREELKTVHEYQADECVLRSGVNAREYQMLLIKKAVGARFPSLANSLNHSKLKKRITMMYNSKTSAGRRRLRALTLAPALAAALLGANMPFVTNAMEALSATELSAPAAASDNKVTQNSAPAKKLDDIIVVGYANTEGAPAMTAVASSKPENALASFPGGERAMMQYLASGVRYPEDAMKAKIQGRVVVRFDVLDNGTVANPEIEKGVSPSLDAEALRVVGGMPRWTPARENGKNITTSYVIPVEFRLVDDDTAAKAKEAKPVVFIDGVQCPYDELSKIDSGNIENIEVIKNKPEYPDGAIYIKLKK